MLKFSHPKTALPVPHILWLSAFHNESSWESSLLMTSNSYSFLNPLVSLIWLQSIFSTEAALAKVINDLTVKSNGYFSGPYLTWQLSAIWHFEHAFPLEMLFSLSFLSVTLSPVELDFLVCTASLDNVLCTLDRLLTFLVVSVFSSVNEE